MKKDRVISTKLIQAPEKTIKSTGLLGFDPSGTFFFEGKRWARVFEAHGNVNSALKASLKTGSVIRFTERIFPQETEKIFVTLIREEADPDRAYVCLKKDEETLKDFMEVRLLAADEAFKAVLADDSFSLVSLVRARKDLLKEAAPDIKEYRDHFVTEGLYGVSMFVMEYPDRPCSDVFSIFKQLGCHAYVTYDFSGVSPEDREDYIRSLEKRYLRNITPGMVADFMNVSCQMAFLCDSKDASSIIEKNVCRAFSKEGFLVSKAYGAQKDSFLSQAFLGLLEYRNFRNVKVSAAEGIFGGRDD